jgi:hypothetical protein
MNTLTHIQKKEALDNALKHFGFPAKYFIYIAGVGKKAQFGIAHEGTHKFAHIAVNCMTYEEMNAYIRGYQRALTNPL